MIRRQRRSILNIFPTRAEQESRRSGGVSRAETIRQKRQTSVSPMADKRPTWPAANSSAVPVTARAGVFGGTPYVQRRQSQVRKKPTLPLNLPGLELQFPAIPVFKPGWRLLSGFIFIALLIFVILLLVSPEFHVTNPQIDGLQRIQAADIIAASKLDSTPVFLINSTVLENNIKELFPELSSLSVKVVFPAQVVITAEERQPLVSWQYGELTSWIDTQGYIFPARGESSPVINVIADCAPPLQPQADDILKEEEQGTDSTSETTEENKINLVDPGFLKNLLLFHDKMSDIQTISFTQAKGYSFQDNNWTVDIGFNLSDLDQKIIVYQAIKKMLLDQGLQPVFVNVAHVHAPFYRME